MGSLGAEDFMLIDTLPGYPAANTPIPANGFDSTVGSGNCVSTSPPYHTGTKIQAYQDSSVGAGGSYVANKGYYTMVYAMYHDFTQGDCSATAVCVLAEGTTGMRGSGLAFTKDMSSGADNTICGPVAIPCHSLSGGQYGWFWCDGICPNYDISRFDCTGFLTDGNVVGQGPLTSYVAHELTIQTGFSWLGNADGTQGVLVVGYAFTDDT